ncbi:attractin-like protein 1 [Glandiceps talaboti]
MADMTNLHFLRSDHTLRRITPRNWINWTKILAVLVVLFTIVNIVYSEECVGDWDCYEGECIDNLCECEPGWAGDNCEHCGGRVKLDTPTGYIADGPSEYKKSHSCTWLIESGLSGSLIRLKFEHFETECAWDYLYIYDGDSVYDPLIATFSGAMLSENEENVTYPEVTTSSGYAYLHFYSDAEYAMSGFNISYSIDTCPLDCSDNGICLNSTQCDCDPEWTGEGCNIPACLSESDCGNHGNCASQLCQCTDDYKGHGCEVPPTSGSWEVYVDKVNQGRASHATVLQDSVVWIVGGYPFTNQANYDDIIRYDIESGTEVPVVPKSSINPDPRYGHSLVLDRDRLIMYGGTVTTNKNKVVNELWFFNITMESWEFYDIATESRIAVDGHTAHMVYKTMIVIFGYSPKHGYTNVVQEFDTVSGVWSVVKTNGVNVNGGYGHSSVYDENYGLIYVYGGIKPKSRATYLSDELYTYDPVLQHWSVLPTSGGHHVYLHSSVMIDGMMYTFGGNPHNDTYGAFGALCFSSNLLAYDTRCETWSFVPLENEIYTDISRYGHRAVSYDGKMYVISGYNNVMVTDIPVYTPGNCSAFDQEDPCLAGSSGISCTWISSEGRCDNVAEVIGMVECPESDENSTSKCDTMNTCNDCELTYGCTWSDGVCTSNYTSTNNGSDSCSGSNYPCSKFYTCSSCALQPECYWSGSSCRYTAFARNSTCDLTCSDQLDCGSCTDNNCMWCGSTQRCVDSNSYTTSFPYGQCMGWYTSRDRCPGVDCSHYDTCDECHDNPSCGWCDDGSNTGLGTCMEGSYSQPEQGNSCPNEQWYFIECPACQCNGHSYCINETICEDCQHNTEGEQCEECSASYYGDPRNGGNCTKCFCNGNADICDNKSGECSCTTKGMTGNECERCDETRKYYGDPTNGTCYYELLMNYRYLFNLSKSEDELVTAINFKCHIDGSSRDVEFNLNADYPCLLKITYTSASSPTESVAFQESIVQNQRVIFSRNEYNFNPSQNFTFYAYINNFTTPFGFDISFSWRIVHLVDLLLFFVTFFTCFLGLLIIAGIVWKVKQRYDGYRRRQARVVEMKQMASRPFAVMRLHVEKEVNSPYVPPNQTQGKASAVAIEPCTGDKAAVLNLIIRLPCTEKGFSPDEYNGMAIGSALVQVNSKKIPENKDKGGSIRRRKQQNQRGSLRGTTTTTTNQQAPPNGANTCASQMEAANGTTTHGNQHPTTHAHHQHSTTHANINEMQNGTTVSA